MLLFDYREKSNIWNKLNLYNLREKTDLETKFKQGNNFKLFKQWDIIFKKNLKFYESTMG